MLEEKKSASKLGITVISSEKLVKREDTYQEIIAKAAESVKNWYQFLTAAVTDEQKITVMVMLVRELIAKYNLKPGFFADVNYEIMKKGYLADDQIWVPAIAFKNKESYLAFTKAAKLSLAQGRSFQITLEEGMRPISIIVYCKEQLPGSLRPEQVRDHEATHALDPNLWQRNDVDALILDEMIATIGELATSQLDNMGAGTSLSFWMGYYRKLEELSPPLLHILGLDIWKTDYSLVELAQATINFISKITAEKPNSEIVRILMSCENFNQVLGKLRMMFPGKY